MSAQRSMCTAFSVHHIDRLRGIYESVGCDRTYRRAHACNEAQARATSSSTRTVHVAIKVLKRLKLSGRSLVAGSHLPQHEQTAA